MEPAQVPLVGDRWTPFYHEIEYQGDDLTGAAFAMHIRLTYDAPGAPVVALATAGQSPPDPGVGLAYAGTATVAAHLAAGRISEVPAGMTEADSLPLSIVTIRIAETTMATMQFPGERGKDAVFYYDLHVTPVGGIKQVWFRGTFTVRAGATQ